MKYYEKRPEALEVLELTDDNKNEILQSGLTITLRRTEIGTLEYFTTVGPNVAEVPLNGKYVAFKDSSKSFCFDRIVLKEVLEREYKERVE